LLATPPGPPGTIGIEVQGLTAAMASLTGAAVGVVVTWVDADAAAGEELRVGDVIEEVDGRALQTREHWDVRMARLSAGETIGLRLRRRSELREITVVAIPSAAPDAIRSLGLTLQTRSRIGAEVVRVDPRTAADHAGLAVGDVITLVGDISAPTPAQVVRSYNSIAQGERVMVAITRGDAHIVTVLER
jgi:S1-C subfamily serine protease